jgi:AmmeMemoRadiSam system protein A
MVPADRSDELDPSMRAYLLTMARRAVALAVGRPDMAPALPTVVRSERLRRPARLFVSWHLGDRLIGCIGTVEPAPSLERGVVYHAVQAGLHDPRTPALRIEELPHLTCEISILSEPRPLGVVGLPAIGRCLTPGRHGVILRVGHRRALFLPVVWRKLPEVSEFLEALCRKAGIDPELEGRRAVAEVFHSRTFRDSSPAGVDALEVSS